MPALSSIYARKTDTRPSHLQRTLPAQKSLTRLAGIAGLILLTGCGVQATQPIWRNNLATQEVATAQGTVVNSASETYQIFSNNGVFNLRKLTPTGTEQWRSVIGNASTYYTNPLIAAVGTEVAVTSSLTEITRFDAAGNASWTYNVAPIGAHIDTVVTQANDTVAIAYSGIGSNSGIIALNSQGAELWRYELSGAPHIQLAPLATGDLFAVADNGVDRVASLYLFDNQGNLAQQQTLTIDSASPKLRYHDNGLFLLHNKTLTRVDEQGNVLWNHEMSDVTDCTAGGNGEAACWIYRMPIVFPPYSSPGYAAITWLDAAGNVKKDLVYADPFALTNRIENLYYNGDHKWTLEKSVTLSTNFFSTSQTRKFSHYTQFNVISEQGLDLKVINMTPSTYATNNPDAPDGYITDGDEATGIVSQGKLYAFGNTRLTKRGFVSTYPLP